ncbi:MAG: RNA polymerase sigma factor SigF [Nocardioides sp.]|uniref:RNA polymerase sigma factor SigF n=1 Tax=Nocardioides sp. TaxID=35761 RepID=UPI0039E279E4
MSGESSSGFEEARARSSALFRALHDPHTSDRPAVRAELITLHVPLVEHLARRFQNRGESYEDLVQVGLVGLIKAIDRFEIERGLEFSTYATPTVVGELKRHLRDKGWAIRVPRRLQELRLQITRVSGDMTQRLGRSPTAGELAKEIGCSVEEIVEGMESGNAWSTISLDAGGDSDDGPDMLDVVGVDDAGLGLVDVRESLKPLLEQLDDRDKRILLLRYFRNLTQSQIAEEIGVSQMHVSRLLAKILAQLRAGLEEPQS